MEKPRCFALRRVSFHFTDSFHGRARPPLYALWSLAVFFSQQVIIFVAFAALARPLTADGWFYVMPLRSLVVLRGVSDLVCRQAEARSGISAN